MHMRPREVAVTILERAVGLILRDNVKMHGKEEAGIRD